MRREISYLPAWLAMLFGAEINATLFIHPVSQTLWSLVAYVVICLATYWLLQKIYFRRHNNRQAADWRASFILFATTLAGQSSEGVLFNLGTGLAREGVILYLLALSAAFVLLWLFSSQTITKSLKYFLLIGCVTTAVMKINGFCKSWLQMTPVENVSLVPASPVAAKPDIYFVLMDEYSGNPALRQYWHYDNSPYHRKLQELGFQPIEHARSHINSTLYEMTCIFNLTAFHHLDYSLRYGNHGFFFNRYFVPNKFFEFLQAQGYALNIDSLFADDDPLFFSPVHTNKFNYHLSSVLGRCLQTKILYNLFYNTELKDSTLESLKGYDHDRLSDLSQILYRRIESTPSFTYVHLLVTHHPYRFAANGTISPNATYLSQIEYNNRLTADFSRQLIDKYKKAHRPLVLILMSDHGSRANASPEEDQSIQMLVYDSSGKMNRLDQDLDGVNLFRILLRTHFNVPLPKQEYPGFTYIYWEPVPSAH